MTDSSPAPGLFETATDQDAIQSAVAAAAPTSLEPPLTWPSSCDAVIA